MLPAVEDNAVVVAAPAPIQGSTVQREDQLLIRASYSHRRPVVFWEHRNSMRKDFLFACRLQSQFLDLKASYHAEIR